MSYQNTMVEFKIDIGPSFTLDAGPGASVYARASSYDDFLAALNARDIEASDLNAVQWSTFAESAMLVDAVDDLKVETLEDVEAIFGGKFKFEIVEGFKATDGTVLNGGATADGKIILDADLSGEELRSVLKEEIAEAAFYKAFDKASEGDFGAEVVASYLGVTDTKTLVQFQSENDTVMTEFGEVQANASEQINQLLNDVSIASTNGTPYNITAYDGFSISEFQYNAFAGNMGENVFGQEAFEALRWFSNETDLDGDGKASNAIEWAIASPGSAGDVLSFSNSKLTPVIGLSDTLLAGQGDASNTWVTSEQQTYKTQQSFKFDAGLKLGANASGSFFGLFDAGASIEVSASVGGGVEISNEFKTIREVRQTYNVDGQDYAPGTIVSYGWHAQLADADVRDGYLVYAKVSDADGVEDYIGFEVTQRGIINDYLSGIVATDVDITELA
ncbi:hypothetical protein [Actibacterium sp. 188UL27-1]|uniref:hypothetical protein n=1 Tax=Actibacterium sp. 188UL27-1 TaxID=2786961 RepID=UPI00195A5023|nr:hypothetical protein [Actibacterium sp. 188UL27-1]MBM7070287.1 hypothetical protein [Actibacterium sp. 188UL27-1]